LPPPLANTEEEPEEEVDEGNSGEVTNQTGKAIGLILANMRDTGMKRFDFKVNGTVWVFEMYVNDQDNVSGKRKKFWSLYPNPTPDLYGFKHYHSLLNTSSHRGWVTPCRLSSSKEGEDREGHGDLCYEFWETRCDRPRVDGIIIHEDGSVDRKQNVEQWLIEHELSSDVNWEFSAEFYRE
jgi:hypothetical protein